MIGAFRSVYRSKVSTCIVEYVGQYCDTVNQSVICLFMSSMSSLSDAGSCRHRFIGVCSKLVNQLSSTIRVVGAVGNTCSKVPVDSVVCL